MARPPSQAALHKAAKAPIAVGVLRASALIGYFRSMAMAIEIQRNTSAQWKTYDESTVLNIAYALMPFKEKPGVMEVHQDWRVIDRNTQALTQKMIDTFFIKLQSGPQTAKDYCAQMHGVRESATMAVQELFADAAQVNAMVAREAADGARNMAKVQFACTLILAGTGCYLALGGAVPAVLATSSVGLKAGAVGLGYNVAGALIKDGASWSSAQAIAIEGGKTGGGELLGNAEKSAQTKLAETIATKSNQISATEANINKLNAEIARKTSEKKIAKLGAQKAAKEAGMQRAQQEMGKAATKQATWKVASKTVPLLFLAHDVYNAWGDLQDVEKQLR